jgi:hypothetical protein
MNMVDIFRKLHTAQHCIKAGRGEYEDIVFKSHHYSLTFEEGFELAKYILGIGEVRSWTGKLILHTGVRFTASEPFVLETAFTKLMGTIDEVEMRRDLTVVEQLGLAKFFLGSPEETVVESKIVLRTNFKRAPGGDIELTE